MEMTLTVSTVPDALRLLRLRHQDSENIDNQDAEKTLLRGSNQPRGWVEAFLYLLAGDCEESGRIDLFASDNYDAFATVKCEGMYYAFNLFDINDDRWLKLSGEGYADADVQKVVDALMRDYTYSAFTEGHYTASAYQPPNKEDWARRDAFKQQEYTDEEIQQLADAGLTLEEAADKLHTAEDAVRIEFWDDEMDSIRSMDAQSQRSVEKLEEASIFPMREMVYTEEQAVSAAERIEQEYRKVLKNLEQKGETENAERLREHIGEDAERLRAEKTLPALGAYADYFYENPVSLLSYLQEDTLLVFDAPERIREHMDILTEEYRESVKGRIAQGYLLPGQSNMLYDYTEILRQAESFAELLLAGLNQKTVDFRPKTMVNLSVRSTPSFQQRADLFCEELEYLKKNHFRTLILAGSGTRAQRMAKELQEMGLEAVYIDSLEKEVPKGAVWVARGTLSKGFRYDYIDFAVFCDSELFGGKEKKKRKKRRKNGAAIESFTDLHIGDYVVHDNHGIGVFRGLEKISVEGVQKDYMKISYRDGGSLFVPVNQMDMVQKYIGTGSAAPKLNKLGGQDWAKAKAKARKAVQIMAEDLVALYAKRAAAQGFVYGADTVWQQEFEESFPYEETDDQLNAIEDVKKDMESSKVMDRLICGDVGYGKTEVAIRAAFKAAQEGKQVAFLVPTTILAQQHYNTFTQRMTGYPVHIELLSRFRTPKQQKESLQNIEKGYSEILIGTHRILSTIPR